MEVNVVGPKSGAGFDDSCGPLSSQNILCYSGFRRTKRFHFVALTWLYDPHSDIHHKPLYICISLAISSILMISLGSQPMTQIDLQTPNKLVSKCCTIFQRYTNNIFQSGNRVK